MTRYRYPWIPLLICLLLGLNLPATAEDDDDGEWQNPGGSAPADTAVSEEREAPPQDEKLKDVKCVVTGLPWLESSTRVEAILRVDGQRLRGRFLSLAYMLIQYKLLQEEGSDVVIETVSVLDFSTFGTDYERMVPVADDWSNIVFIATDTPLKGSREPYYAAYSTVEDTKAGLERLGGKVLSYEALMKRLLGALRSTDESSRMVESETDGMRKTFRGFDPTRDPDEK